VAETAERAEEVLSFWFADALDGREALERRMEFWFGGERDAGNTGAIDRQIEGQFGPDMERAARGGLASWAPTPRGRLALILLLDQFPRNVFRGTARAFATDSMALELALSGMHLGADTALHVVERLFLYMPLQHAERTDVQEQSVAAVVALAVDAPVPLRPLFEECVRFAQQHRDIVRRFGRFPHRNAILGRASTPEEREFLALVASSFGQRA
jgi:uncharacterized protein (DUF924 family)